MNIKRSDLDNLDRLSTFDESDSTHIIQCPAEVAPFQPCAKKMRRRKNGVTVCPDHGEMR